MIRRQRPFPPKAIPDQPEAHDYQDGRLLARPGPPQTRGPGGVLPLGLTTGRDALILVPRSYRPERLAPLAVMLHEAGGTARQGLSFFGPFAEDAGLILLAPESRGRTWDIILGAYGPDAAYLDRALVWTFERYAVDPRCLAIGGFSDGASYALSLGLTNGDLFGHVIAFSPGFMAPAAARGKPAIFDSHGRRDDVLPIGVTSHELVPRLERAGYEVRYEEFDGGHTVPPDIARDALDWFLQGG
jgi:predicted esterase